MLPSWTIPTSYSKAGVTDNLYIADPSQKQPAASDNVQNHTQVTEVVELAFPAIWDSSSFRSKRRGLKTSFFSQGFSIFTPKKDKWLTEAKNHEV
jgi:hypothetical protein